MRAFRAGFAALALGAALAAGCSQQGSGARGELNIDAKSVEGFVTKLAGESFKGKATAAADLASVRDVLPKEVAMTWGNLSFDSATNSTLLTDVKLTPKDIPQVGLGIQELRLFDFDADFAKARLTGQRLTETAALASRIDAKGVSMFGMVAMMNSMVGLPPTDGGVEPPHADPIAPDDPTAPPADWPPGTEPAFDFDAATPVFEKFDFTFGRLILNDIVLRAIEATPAPVASAATLDPYNAMGPEAEAMFRGYVNVLRAFGVDTFAAYDMKGDLAMNQMGQTLGLSFGAKSTGTRGWRGGDSDASYIRDLSYQFNMTEGPMAPAMSMAYSIGYLGMEDLRFDKLYGYMAKGVAPPRTDTDLLSYGKYDFQDQKLNIGGKDIMTVGEASLDARDFHWFIPTKITTSVKDAVFDVAAMMEMAESAAATFAMPDPYDPDAPPITEPTPDFSAIRAVLEKNGLAKPNVNFNFGYTWNETSGDTKVDLGFGGKDLMQIDTKFEGGFPSFKAVSDLIPDDPMQTNEAAIAQVFDEKSTLKLVDVKITDEGGIAKMFNLSAEMATLMNGGMDMGMGPMNGDQMRQMAAQGIQMLAIQAGPQMPEIPKMLTPISDFLLGGGKLRFLVQPAKPMTFMQIGERMMSAGMSGAMDPSQAIKELGLKVEHSK